jgi:competence protein ComGD
MEERRNGFTLTETLVVLSVFLAISSASLILVKPAYHLLEKNLFFSQLKSDLLFAQQYAISHQEEVTVHIMPELNHYYIRTRANGPFLVERHYSDAIRVMEGSIQLYFHYSASGNINKFGSFYVEINKQFYRFTILIGRGRFYVVKE